MKSAIQEILEYPKAEKGIARVTASVHFDDLAFIDAIAREFGTSRSKLIENAIKNGARANYVFLEDSEDPEMRKSLDRIIDDMEATVGSETGSPSNQGPFTSYGLHHYGQVSFTEQGE